MRRKPGKTTRPISILCINVEETPELKALAEQGHKVWYENDPEMWPADADVIIGPKCWRWLPGISEKWLPQLLKEVRATQPPRPKKAKVKKSGTATS